MSEPVYWRCPNCGQIYFGNPPPDICAFCQDYTTWQRFRTPTAQKDDHNRDEGYVHDKRRDT